MEHAYETSLVQMLETVTERWPDRVALWVDDESVTYAELRARSLSYANALTGLGIGKGDVVATQMANCAEHIYLLFGVAYIGAVEAAINTTFRGHFLSHQLVLSRCRLVLVDEDLAPQVLAVAPECPALERLLVRGRHTPAAGLMVGSTEELLAGGTEVPAYRPRWDDPCTIQFTSGTSGPSKAALLTQSYMVNWARQFSKLWYRSPEDNFLVVTPLFHLAAKGNGVLAALYHGCGAVLDSRFSVTTFWDRVQRYGAVSTTLIGAMITMLWQRRDESPAQVTLRNPIVVPIPPDLHRQIEERWDLRMMGVFGLSEAGPIVLGGLDGPLAPGVVGRLNDEMFEMAVVDDDDRPLPPGTPGEVVVRPRRSNAMFVCYFGQPEETLKTFRNLWFHTGDIGVLDERGGFAFVDRKKDYIRRRGENISSYEVELSVMAHQAVSEVAAIAVSSEFTENEVKVCVVLRPDADLDHEALLEFLAGTMPYFAVPRYIEFLHELPKTPSQKVEKFRLRQIGVGGSTWDCEQAGIRITRQGLVRSADVAVGVGSKPVRKQVS
jgi:crotonobetaine/carnitine-CoA ligase